MIQRIGKYEVSERIGRGGMGTIFKARDPILERAVALKVLSSLEVTPELRAGFFREAQACARLSHPNPRFRRLALSGGRGSAAWGRGSMGVASAVHRRAEAALGQRVSDKARGLFSCRARSAK